MSRGVCHLRMSFSFQPWLNFQEKSANTWQHIIRYSHTVKMRFANSDHQMLNHVDSTWRMTWIWICELAEWGWVNARSGWEESCDCSQIETGEVEMEIFAKTASNKMGKVEGQETWWLWPSREERVSLSARTRWRWFSRGWSSDGVPRGGDRPLGFERAHLRRGTPSALLICSHRWPTHFRSQYSLFCKEQKIPSAVTQFTFNKKFLNAWTL